MYLSREGISAVCMMVKWQVQEGRGVEHRVVWDGDAGWSWPQCTWWQMHTLRIPALHWWGIPPSSTNIQHPPFPFHHPCSFPCVCSPPGSNTRGLVGQHKCQVIRPQVRRLTL